MLSLTASLYRKSSYRSALFLTFLQLVTTWSVSYGWVGMMDSLVEVIKTENDSDFRFWVIWWFCASIINVLVDMFLKKANVALQAEIRVLFYSHGYQDVLANLNPNERQKLEIGTFSNDMEKCWGSVENTIQWVPDLLKCATKIITRTYYVATINVFMATWIFMTYTLSWILSDTFHYSKVAAQRKMDQKKHSQFNTTSQRLFAPYGACPSEDTSSLGTLVLQEGKIADIESWYELSWNTFHLVMALIRVITTIGVIMFTPYNSMMTVITLSTGMQDSMNTFVWFAGSTKQNQTKASNYLDKLKELIPRCTYTLPTTQKCVSSIVLHNANLKLTKGERTFTLVCDYLRLLPGINVFRGGTGEGKSTLMKVFTGAFLGSHHFTTDDGQLLDIQSVEKRYIGGSMLKVPCSQSFAEMCAVQNPTPTEMWKALEICCIASYVCELGGLDKPLSGSDDATVGATTSTGETERLNVAAALAGIKDGTALFIDEIVGGLPREMAQQVLLNIQEAFPKSIIVLTDHTPENLELVDVSQTVTLTNGVVTTSIF